MSNFNSIGGKGRGHPEREGMRADKLIFFCIRVMSARLRELVDVVGTTL